LPPTALRASASAGPWLDETVNVGRGELDAAIAAGGDEKTRIVKALAACHGNQTQAAKLLGISRRTLVTRMEDYALPRPRKRVDDT